MGEVIVSLVNVNKMYGRNHVVKNLNLDIEKGEFLTLLGPSGCGKTTTLRMIAGFEDASAGVITVEGERVEDKEPYERNVNTVFQSYALFPHMTVYDNVAYGLKIKKVPKEEIKTRVEEMLEMVRLKGFEKRKPSQMSGGQKQRVAIARALINRPKVLLLDEPLGALDLKLRKQMQLELKRLQKLLQITFVYVTHDQEEALTMSDRIAVMKDGVLEQICAPKEIYEHPKTRFVAGFIGESNIFDTLAGKTNGKVLDFRMEVGSGQVEVNDISFAENEAFHVSVRPENTKISKEPVEGFNIRGMIKEYVYVGNMVKAIIVLNTGEEIKVNRLHEFDYAVDDTVYIYWDLDAAVPIKKAQDVIQADTMSMFQTGAKEEA